LDYGRILEKDNKGHAGVRYQEFPSSAANRASSRSRRSNALGLTCLQVAKLLGYHRATVRNLLEEGRLRGKQDERGDWYVQKVDVLAYQEAMQARGVGTKEAAAQLGVRTPCVIAWIRNGLLDGEYADGRWWVKPDSIERRKAGLAKQVVCAKQGE
jgi:excisionase family DNA binding protein